MPIVFFGTLSVSPAVASVGATITIDNTGAGFFDTMVVTVDGVAADNIAVDTGYGNGQQRITCDVPVGAGPGVVNIVVTNPDGETGTIAGGLEIPDILANASIHTGTGCIVG